MVEKFFFLDGRRKGIIFISRDDSVLFYVSIYFIQYMTPHIHVASVFEYNLYIYYILRYQENYPQ